MGKTGLIKHLFHLLEEKEDVYLFYIDIQQTNNLNDFLNSLVNGLIKHQKRTVFDKFWVLSSNLDLSFLLTP